VRLISDTSEARPRRAHYPDPRRHRYRRRLAIRATANGYSWRRFAPPD